MKLKLIFATFGVLTAALMWAAGNGDGPTTPPAQAPQGPVENLVTINAKGEDVRDVLSSLFGQAKENFVVDPNVHYVLWLSLNKVDFDAALGIVCHTANLSAREDGRIWYVKQLPFTHAPAKPTPPPLTNKDLEKKVTLKFKKSSLKDVLANLTTQTTIPIVLDKTVPSFTLDAHLWHKSLKYALDVLTNATHLKYKLDGAQVLVFKPAPPAPVQVDPH